MNGRKAIALLSLAAMLGVGLEEAPPELAEREPKEPPLPPPPSRGRGLYAEPGAVPTPIVGVEQMRRDAHAAAADPRNPNRERDAGVARYFDELARVKARELSAKPGDAERLAAAAERRARKAAKRAEHARRQRGG